MFPSCYCWSLMFIDSVIVLLTFCCVNVGVDDADYGVTKGVKRTVRYSENVISLACIVSCSVSTVVIAVTHHYCW